MTDQSYKQSIALAMHDILDANENAVLLGQGVTDPTRIFGTTVELIEKFAEQKEFIFKIRMNPFTRQK